MQMQTLKLAETKLFAYIIPCVDYKVRVDLVVQRIQLIMKVTSQI